MKSNDFSSKMESYRKIKHRDDQHKIHNRVLFIFLLLPFVFYSLDSLSVIKA